MRPVHLRCVVLSVVLSASNAVMGARQKSLPNSRVAYPAPLSGAYSLDADALEHRCDLPVLDGARLSVEDFRDHFRGRHPVLIKNLTTEWRAQVGTTPTLEQRSRPCGVDGRNCRARRRSTGWLGRMCVLGVRCGASRPCAHACSRHIVGRPRGIGSTWLRLSGPSALRRSR